MTFIELAEACSVYQCSESVSLSTRRAKHVGLGAFIMAFYRFKKNYREELEDEYWKPFVGFLKRQSYLMQAVPAPFSTIRNLDPAALKKATSFLNRIKYVFPDMEDDARALFKTYDQVSSLDENPIGDLIRDEFLASKASEYHSAILIRDSRWVSLAEDVFGGYKRFRKLHVISPESLRDGVCYENIFCVGPARWFDDYVFSSARSASVTVFCYKWIRDRQPKLSSFPVGSTEVVSRNPRPSIKKDRLIFVDSNDSSHEFVDAQDLIPIVNIASIQKRINQEKDATDFNHEIEARLFVLEGDCLVMLEAANDSKTLVIDPLSWHNGVDGAEATVNRIQTSEIEPGMFVLIRSGGGGDYVAPIADQILGDRARFLRDSQDQWKNLLKIRAHELGTEETIQSLKKLGSDKANYINLVNWMSAKSIKTRDYADFEAIMRLIGLEEQAEQLWDAAQEIHAAHRSAGFEIRRALIERISQTSIGDLQKTGRATFSIGESDEGSMTVLRVKKVLQESFTVSESSLGKLIEGSDDLWQ